MKNPKKKKTFDAVAVFKRVANSGPSVDTYDSDAAYEEEMEERARRCGYFSDKKSEAKG